MEKNVTGVSEPKRKLHCELGSFDGFNFRKSCAIERHLKAQDVIDWNHDMEGEAEFWPCGDHTGVSLVFRDQTAATASQLIALDSLISEAGDVDTTYLKIYYEVHCLGHDLCELTDEKLSDSNVYIFVGHSFIDLHKEAAYELFEAFWPDAYKMWESCDCDGLHFDEERFLDSPSWSVEHVLYGGQKALLVAPN